MIPSPQVQVPATGSTSGLRHRRGFLKWFSCTQSASNAEMVDGRIVSNAQIQTNTRPNLSNKDTNFQSRELQQLANCPAKSFFNWNRKSRRSVPLGGSITNRFAHTRLA